MSSFAATEYVVNGLVQPLAAEHAREGIRINSLRHAGTMTPAESKRNLEIHAPVAGVHLIKRIVRRHK